MSDIYVPIILNPNSTLDLKAFHNLVPTWLFQVHLPISLSLLCTPYINLALQTPWPTCPFLSVCVVPCPGKSAFLNGPENSQLPFETYLHLLCSDYTLSVSVL